MISTEKRSVEEAAVGVTTQRPQCSAHRQPETLSDGAELSST